MTAAEALLALGSGPLQGVRPVPGHRRAWFGRGVAARLQDLLDEFDARRCLFVRGASSYDQCGVARYVERAGRGRAAAHVRAATHQTTLAAVAAALALADAFDADTIVGIGGGNALDLAKALSVLRACDTRELRSMVRAGRPVQRFRRLILMPTTAGSGSELTPFATLWDDHDKLSLDAPALIADAVLIDPDLLHSVPPKVAVAAAADALCQSAESYWAVAATAESRTLAAAAFRNLLPAISGGCRASHLTDRHVQERIAWSASLAGAAIAISRTTAAHALSYALTSRLGLPHGAAVLLQLPWLFSHNRAASRDDCRLAGGPERLRALIDDLTGWCREATDDGPDELARRLLFLGGYPADHAALPDGAWQDDWLAATRSPRMANNPRVVTELDIRRLLDRRRSGHG